MSDQDELDDPIQGNPLDKDVDSSMKSPQVSDKSGSANKTTSSRKKRRKKAKNKKRKKKKSRA